MQQILTKATDCAGALHWANKGRWIDHVWIKNKEKIVNILYI